jgi:hypothetical protein
LLWLCSVQLYQLGARHLKEMCTHTMCAPPFSNQTKQQSNPTGKCHVRHQSKQNEICRIIKTLAHRAVANITATSPLRTSTSSHMRQRQFMHFTRHFVMGDTYRSYNMSSLI